MNLGSNQEATLAMPVDASRVQGVLPPQVKLWRYDEISRNLVEAGVATLEGNKYVAKIRHLSVFMAALDAKTGDACIQIQNNSNVPVPFEMLHSFTVQEQVVINRRIVTINVRVEGTDIVPGQFAVISDLPENKNVAISFPGALANVFNVSSGGSAGAAPPLFPFNSCKGRLALPNPLPPQTITPDAWLVQPAGRGSGTETLIYYKYLLSLTRQSTSGTCPPGVIDCLAAFRDRNHFIANDTVAYYYNAGDLGLGREMHCFYGGLDAACYVTNYGVVAADPAPAADPAAAVLEAILRQTPFATVAMEYIASSPEPVRFYVYDGAGNLFLDGQGNGHAIALDGDPIPKFAPQICLPCHGGTYRSPTTSGGAGPAVSGAGFLPFDVYSYIYSNVIFLSGTFNVDYLHIAQPNFFVTSYKLADQQESFRILNKIVRDTNPPSLVQQFIDGIYPAGVGNQGSLAQDCYANFLATQIGPPPFLPCFTPQGWTGQAQSQLYQTVVRANCRTCHSMQTPPFDWASYASFTGQCNLINIEINQRYFMPHAEVPDMHFWLFPGPPSAVDSLVQACP